MHLEPVSFIVRFYHDNNTYEDKSPFVCVATITKTGENGYIQAMHGELCKEHYRNLFVQVGKIGIKFLTGERNGIVRVWDVDRMNNIMNPVLDVDAKVA